MKYTEEDKKSIENFKYWIQTNTERGVCTIPDYICINALNLLEKQQKEIKELKEDIEEYYKPTLDIFDEREYRKKYLEERRKEEPNLLYPDGDEIYKRYYEQKEIIKELQLNIKDLKSKTQIISPLYVKENYIPKEKIREKIKRLIQKLNESNDDRWEKDDNIYYDKIKCQIRILKELLGDE